MSIRSSIATLPAMTTIPQRELRNQISEILRRVEQGEEFTVTVSGRAVAELRPVERARKHGTLSDLKRIFEQTPVDPGWADELMRMREEDRALGVDIWRD